MPGSVNDGRSPFVVQRDCVDTSSGWRIDSPSSGVALGSFALIFASVFLPTRPSHCPYWPGNSRFWQACTAFKVSGPNRPSGSPDAPPGNDFGQGTPSQTRARWLRLMASRSRWGRRYLTDRPPERALDRESVTTGTNGTVS